MLAGPRAWPGPSQEASDKREERRAFLDPQREYGCQIDGRRREAASYDRHPRDDAREPQPALDLPRRGKRREGGEQGGEEDLARRARERSAAHGADLSPEH